MQELKKEVKNLLKKTLTRMKKKSWMKHQEISVHVFMCDFVSFKSVGHWFGSSLHV